MRQLEALNILKLGYNVFLTGAAGAGKTYVLNEFIGHLKKNKIGVGITASTGIAATHMGGMTIHSWAGIGINDDLDESGLKSLLEKAPLVKRFAETRVLIIDEVSMLHGQRLDLVDKVCRVFKDPSKPFGGLQVVLSGDLFQLPPVTRSGDVDWVFKSAAWRSMDLKVCYLTEQHRQEDTELLDILNAVRDGEVEEYHQNLLAERLNPELLANYSMPVTKLYTHNADVDSINQKELKQIDADAKTFVMTSVKGGKRLIEALQASCLAPAVLKLKVGSEVMFVANNPAERYVNGTRGVVVAFTDESLPVIVTKDDRTIVAKKFSWKIADGDKIRAEISQIPLRLAWAITIHKSQGMSLDAAEIDLSRAFEPGMGYVAISRVRSLNGLFLKGVNSNALLIHPEVKVFDEVIQRRSAQLVDALEKMEAEVLERHHIKVLTALAPELPEDIEYDDDIYNKLTAWRRKKATELSRPGYAVFKDETLKQIAAIQPVEEVAMLKIKGVGPKKLEDFAAEIIEIVKLHNTGV